MRAKKGNFIGLIDKALSLLKLLLLAWTEPLCWLIDKRAETILDVGCGKGVPMLLIKARMKPKKTVGVDIFKPYLTEAKRAKTHSEYLLRDIRDLPFKKKSFDVVIANQVLEHLSKKDAWKVLEKMENIAKIQVIVSTPVGRMDNKMVDNNVYQIHKSYFLPEEFRKRGYSVMLWGRKSIDKMLYSFNNSFLRRIVHLAFLITSPIYFIFPKAGNFYIYAHREING